MKSVLVVIATLVFLGFVFNRTVLFIENWRKK